MMRVAVCALLAVALTTEAPASGLTQQVEGQTPTAVQMTAAERRQVLEGLARELEARYLIPEVGRKYAAMLRANLAAGRYDQLSDPDAFSREVTSDLLAVHWDGHLKLDLQERFPTPLVGRGPAGYDPSRALEEARMIGDVAYLRFNMFPNDPQVAARAREFLVQNAGARAVVIDARDSRGGTTMVMDTILPLFYSERTVLVRTDHRSDAEIGAGLPSMVRQPAPPGISRADHMVEPDAGERRLRSTPLFYLTSRRTGSAAEHLALALKRTKRGTVVGEPTAGRGHFGFPVRLGDRLAAFIPVGRTYDPDTGAGFEGTGVPPDVLTPAEEALDRALELARAATAG